MLTDQIVTMYATSTKPLPKLSAADRMWCYEQLVGGQSVPFDRSDASLCRAVLRAWADKAAGDPVAERRRLDDEYWNGEPETLCDGRPLWLRFWEWLTQ